MEPTVLAGPVEFSPADIALILGALAAAFLVLTAPGWVIVGYAAHRRSRARGARRTWPAALGGCTAGLAVSMAVSAFVAGLPVDTGGAVFAIGVLGSWLACWGLAWLWLRSARPVPPSGPHAAPAPGQQGWGR